MSKCRSKLHLHIGRNKAGSTTLQRHWVKNLGGLQRAGITYAMFGQPCPPGVQAPTVESHHALIDLMQEHCAEAVLISHEGICCFSPDVTRAMANDLAALDVQVIFYVRPYREWVVSSYAFDVRMGIVTDDFDTYLDKIWPTISFWPAIEIWGEALGWRNVRVRSLHPLDLLEGDLVRDGDAAIGVALPVDGPVARANVSPSWMVVEMLRSIAAQDAPSGWSRNGQAVAEALHEYMDDTLKRLELSSNGANYLRREDSRLLIEAYNNDLATLYLKSQVPLQPDIGIDVEERSFLPSIEFVPSAILRKIQLQALEAKAAHLHPEAAEFVCLPDFNRLCEP